MPPSNSEKPAAYIRFQTLVRDASSHSPTGVFQAAIELRDSGRLENHELDEIERNLAWLRMHLKSPACLREPGNDRAIAWFHPRAREPIRRVRAIIEILREHETRVDEILSRSPGTIIYEDGWQVVAKPTRKRSR